MPSAASSEQFVIKSPSASVHESRAPERAKGLGPRLGLAGWSFFVFLFELREVRLHRAFLWRHRSLCAGGIHTDLTPEVSGSAVAYGVDAGLLKPVLWCFLGGHQTEQKVFLRAPFVFNSPGVHQ